MKIALIVLGVLVLIVVGVIILYFILKEKNAQNRENIAEKMGDNLVSTSVFVIDKGFKKMNEAGFSKAVLDSIPKKAKKAKLPVVKAKVGPKIMTLACDTDIIDKITPKTEMRVKLAGAYIVEAVPVRKKGSNKNTGNNRRKKK